MTPPNLLAYMKRMIRSPRKSSLICLLLAPLVHGAVPAALPDKEEPLDTMLVESAQAQLNEVLQEMVLSEDRFFKRYNELNTKDDFDMLCFKEARVGTLIQQRYCLAKYMNRAMQIHGEGYAEALKNMGSGQPWIPPTPATIIIEGRREGFKQNMRDVVAKHPELVKMLAERYELGKRYEATRRKLFGLRPPPEESKAAPSEQIPP